MKLDLLALLLPKSLDMSGIGSGKSNDTVTPQDIAVILAYAKLSNDELNLLMAKFLEDDSARKSLAKSVKNIAMDLFNDEDIINTVVDTAIIEIFTDTTCFFCNGTGQIIIQESVDKCLHCHNGIFKWTDFSRSNIMGLKKETYVSIRKSYKELTDRLIDIEQSALRKIGDSK
jgi:hypothetical protein|tara:strand:+ start:226 stop:744 length:519 start_codon:yes stop_codon:yes gene_type:complete